ncbi:MAG: hypothetical protein ABIR66_10280 [Saprospiraceae bacterium]
MKIFLIFSLVLVSIVLMNCNSSKKTTAMPKAKAEPVVSWSNDVLPILKGSCTPCHFPETGKKKLLDTYDAAKTNIDDIISRIQLPTTDDKFMPFKSKKPPLNDSLINVFVLWKKQMMPI